MNLRGSDEGKYGANTHFSAHLRRKILHAAHGLTTTLTGILGEDGGGERRMVEDGLRFASLHSILDAVERERRERESEVVGCEAERIKYK